MTDRFRAPRAHGFPQQQPATGRVRRTEDPLAELARLIGQEDPFADFVTHRPADARAAAPGSNIGVQRRPRTNDSRGYDGRPTDRGTERIRPPVTARAPEPADDPVEEQDIHEAPRGHRAAYAYGGGRIPRADAAPPVSTRGFRDDRAQPVRAPQPRTDDEHRAPAYDDDDSHLPEHDVHDAHDDDVHAMRRPAAPADEDGYDQYPPADYDPDYDDDAYIPAHGEEFYDEAPPRRLKPWMMVAFAAVAAVMVGTSGLFAYRAVFGVPTASTPPKTIRAEAGPTKMLPSSESKTAEGGTNKQIYDRLGGSAVAGGERIVSREERPIDPDRIPQGSPSPRAPAGTASAAPQLLSGPSQATPVASTEPRRVRTVTVRADGTIVPDQGRSTTTGSTTRAASSAQPSVSNSPMALQGQSGSPSAVLPPPRPSANSATPSDNPWAAGQQSAGQTQAALPPQAQPGPPAQSAPPPIIAVNTPPPAGSYVVQVAAQKTEADAQASWQQLQQRYNSILGSQQATIRRYDLGERGVFYRAQVGPFTSRAQASEVCQSLKAAGGDCVIQRN